MKEPKDKRTKEYREWKALQHEVIEPIELTESVGLGDVVEKITKVTGVKKVVEAIAKKLDKDCGCKERKAFLNKIPVLRKSKVVRCLDDTQSEQYKEFISVRRDNKWTQEQQELLIELYAHAFALQYNIKDFNKGCAGCAKTLKSIQDRLDSVYYEM